MVRLNYDQLIFQQTAMNCLIFQKHNNKLKKKKKNRELHTKNYLDVVLYYYQKEPQAAADAGEKKIEVYSQQTQIQILNTPKDNYYYYENEFDETELTVK